MKSPIGLAQRKKRFHDWLDCSRPWAGPNADMYITMESIVAMAAHCFADDPLPMSKEYVAMLEDAARSLSASGHHHELAEHGLCSCSDCTIGLD